ncbi:MAG TPA: response regulator [Candidatus Omnitrophota bacterium]|nr:response regulator [Candidatus Omnitrophota bacterium]HPS20590.1 response regulator [Candidatus Omnitrophota bacterium]
MGKKKEENNNLGKIILADDNEDICDLVEDALMRAGYTVESVSNGFSLITYLKENQDVDAVILDLVMPEKGGESVFDTIRSISPISKIIIYTGYSRYRYSAMGKNADAFIEKTEGIDKIIQTLKELL